MFDVSVVQRHLTTKHVGRKVIYKAVTGTTMDDAEQGAKIGAGHGVAYVADTQTHARGSKGRSWDAKSSGNIYVSLIIHRDTDKDKPVPERNKENDIELAASLATLTVLKDRGMEEVKVKWLNDLWVKGHKLLGALAEFKGVINVEGQEKYLYILGIGLNMNSDMRHQSELRGLATSTFCETGNQFPREEIFAEICNHLEKYLGKSREELIEMYNQHAALKFGDNLRVYFTDTALVSKLCKYRGVKDNWSIELEGPDGVTFSASSPELSIRPQPDKAVYILNSPHIENWSYTLLMKTCYSLVNTMKYDVKNITIEAFQRGEPANCALLVIGQLNKPTDQSLNGLVHEYVKRGGACLCVGTACRLFAEIDDGSDLTDDKTKPCLISTRTCDRRSAIAQHGVSNLLTFDAPSLPSMTVSNGNNHKVLATFVKNDNKSCNNNATATSENNNEQIPVEKLQLRNEDDTKDDTKSVNPTPISDNPCIVMCGIEKGRLCLCWPNIEVSYADLNEYFPQHKDYGEVLQKTVFVRDCLFQQMLESCDL